MREESTAALTVAQPNAGAMAAPEPKAIIQQATREAAELSRVIEDRKLYSVISGRKHVRVEGWTTLAIMRGCIPREVETTASEDGSYLSVVELVRLIDGAVLTRASAECGGPAEPVWQNRAPYARRSMAQTRAAGKACRIAFSWVMALTGYETTPAEEMDDAGTRGGASESKPRGPQTRSATAAQINALRKLAKSGKLSEDQAANIAKLIQSDPTSRQASAMIAKATAAIRAANSEPEPPPPAEPEDEPPPPPDEPEDGPPPATSSDREYGEKW